MKLLKVRITHQIFFRREFYAHIYLNEMKLKFIYLIKKKKKKKK